MRSSGQPLPSFAFWIPRTSTGACRAGLPPDSPRSGRSRPSGCRPRRTRRRAGWRSPCGCWRSPRRASRRRAGRGSSGLRCRSCRCPAGPARGAPSGRAAEHRLAAASGASPWATRSSRATKLDVFGGDAGAPIRGGTRLSESNAAHRGLSAAKPPDTTASCELGETLPQHLVLDVVERHQRHRVRHGRVASPLQVDRAGGFVQRDHGPAESPRFPAFGNKSERSNGYART